MKTWIFRQTVREAYTHIGTKYIISQLIPFHQNFNLVITLIYLRFSAFQPCTVHFPLPGLSTYQFFLLFTLNSSFLEIQTNNSRLHNS
jgi:hypothetical protein